MMTKGGGDDWGPAIFPIFATWLVVAARDAPFVAAGVDATASERHVPISGRNISLQTPRYLILFMRLLLTYQWRSLLCRFCHRKSFGMVALWCSRCWFSGPTIPSQRLRGRYAWPASSLSNSLEASCCQRERQYHESNCDCIWKWLSKEHQQSVGRRSTLWSHSWAQPICEGGCGCE
jgi:hypothetical protein